MRDRIYLILFLLFAGVLLYLGRDFIRGSDLVAWGLTFGGTATGAVLLVTLYRIRIELANSRHALAMKEAELNFARQVQLALFPKHLPSGDGLEFSALCIPARGVSGDYYDILRLADGRLAFAIADISGKGISAAILMANLQALLRVVTQSAKLPSEVCSKLNVHLHAVTDESKFATFFYAEWNSTERSLRYVNAGHNPPLLVSAGGSRLLEEGGIPLGIMPDWEYEVGEVTLANDDLLVLYSDGITEAGFNNGKEFGEARLASLVARMRNRPLADIQKSILQSVQSWAGNEPEDDMTLVLVRAREHQAIE